MLRAFLRASQALGCHTVRVAWEKYSRKGLKCTRARMPRFGPINLHFVTVSSHRLWDFVNTYFVEFQARNVWYYMYCPPYKILLDFLCARSIIHFYRAGRCFRYFLQVCCNI